MLNLDQRIKEAESELEFVKQQLKVCKTVGVQEQNQIYNRCELICTLKVLIGTLYFVHTIVVQYLQCALYTCMVSVPIKIRSVQITLHNR